ncbi:MAG: hypothetical protein HYV09_36335 [Deltaproteobacteria bacterium]|nr:hypothetical protein [Deltaproteobacteria bacterium]
MSASILLATPPALAETEPAEDDEEDAQVSEPKEAAPASRKSRRTWYGWQTLTTDAVALPLFLLAGADSEPAALFGVLTGLTTYVFGAPIIHAAHHSPAKAFGSFGLRLAAPGIGAVLGCAAYGESEGLGCLPGAALGALVGHATAVVIDSAVLAYDDRGKKRSSSNAGGFVVPTATWSGDGGTIALLGAF